MAKQSIYTIDEFISGSDLQVKTPRTYEEAGVLLGGVSRQTVWELHKHHTEGKRNVFVIRTEKGKKYYYEWVQLRYQSKKKVKKWPTNIVTAK